MNLHGISGIYRVLRRISGVLFSSLEILTVEKELKELQVFSFTILFRIL